VEHVGKKLILLVRGFAAYVFRRELWCTVHVLCFGQAGMVHRGGGQLTATGLYAA
jgi:hypothetical protein